MAPDTFLLSDLKSPCASLSAREKLVILFFALAMNSSATGPFNLTAMSRAYWQSAPIPLLLSLA